MKNFMNSSTGKGMLKIILAVVAVFAVLIVGCGGCKGLNRPGATQVGVIRNGGPLDSKTIREVRPPASTYAVSGLFSQPRMYIAGNEQRYYKVSSDPSLGSASGADYIQVPTKDGVLVSVDAQVLFKTQFTDPTGVLTPETDALVRKFDTLYGNRKFNSKSGGEAPVWDGAKGWNAFLDTMFRPIVENAFREQVGSVNCADLVSSCALVQSSGNQASFVTENADDNTRNFERIQNEVQDQIESGIKKALGDEYLVAFNVQLTKITLPDDVQIAINQAQASFAQIAEARAQNIQSKYQARRNARLAASYEQSPALAQIEIAKELKGSNATIILGTTGMGYNLGSGGK